MQIFSYYTGLILLWLTQLTGSLGSAIIVFSILLKTALLPLAYGSQKQMEKMRQLQPEINKLKEKFKNNPQGLQKAQAELFKKEKINPISGCIPQIVQIAILIMLYQVFVQVFQNSAINGSTISTQWLWLDLAKPDNTYLIPIIAGLTQFILSYMMLPKKTEDEKQNKVVAKTNNNDKQDDFSAMGESLQKQMVFMLPIMTTMSLILFNLPSGLGLYWIVTTIYMIIQQYFVIGLGALEKYVAMIPFLGEKIVSYHPPFRIEPLKNDEKARKDNSQPRNRDKKYKNKNKNK